MERLLEVLLDLVFPPKICCLCRTPGHFSSRRPWCRECSDKIEHAAHLYTICKKCGKFMKNSEDLCMDCAATEPPFAIARSVGPYEECFRKIIKLYKFLNRRSLAPVMAGMMADVVLDTPGFWPLDVVVSVPLSQEALCARGFNQSDLLAKKIAKKIKVKYESDVLIRVKNTPPQRELSREEREINLLGAFEVKEKKKICGKNVLLVDDVYTTGSTVRECTRSLLQAGAQRVAVISWAAGKGF